MRHVKANGVEIACEIMGAGPPIVLCHGGEADHRNFYNFAPLLADRFTVIACDQRDTGETRNGPEPYTVADLGRDVGALIAALGYERANVLGTSFGGVIAQEAALLCPERVDHLVLSVTWSGGEAWVTDEFYALARSVKTPEQTRQYWRNFFSRGFDREHPGEIDVRMEKVVVSRTPEQRARRGGSLGERDARERLKTLKCPTMVLSGSDDRIVDPIHARKLAALIPGARLEILEGVGHGTTMEAPERVAALVKEFILG